MPLGKFVTLQRGFDLPTRVRGDGNVPVLGSFGVTGTHDETRVPGPGVTIGRSGASIGVATFSAIPFWPLNTTLYVRDFHGNDERFAYYLLRDLDFRRFNSGSAQPSLNRNYIHPIEVTVPEVDEQRAIAYILGALDDKIELNREMNRTLEATAQAIFRSWFVDFDPVVAKADGRKPFGMSDELAALFPDRFVESDLGPIPEGWDEGKLGDISQLKRRAVQPDDLPAETPYIGLEHMPQRQIALSNWGRADEVSSNKSGFSEGEILFGKLRPYLHKIGVAFLEGICSTDILVLEEKQPKWFGIALGHLASPELVAYADATSSGTRQPRTSWQALSSYQICIPDGDISDIYTTLIAPMIERLKANVFESNTLAALRDLLLPKLLSGEIRVAEAESAVEAAL